LSGSQPGGFLIFPELSNPVSPPAQPGDYSGEFKLNVAFPTAMSLFFIVSSFSLQTISGILLCFFGIWLIIVE
jgi:hypothetical protein